MSSGGCIHVYAFVILSPGINRNNKQRWGVYSCVCVCHAVSGYRLQQKANMMCVFMCVHVYVFAILSPGTNHNKRQRWDVYSCVCVCHSAFRYRPQQKANNRCVFMCMHLSFCLQVQTTTKSRHAVCIHVYVFVILSPGTMGIWQRVTRDGGEASTFCGNGHGPMESSLLNDTWCLTQSPQRWTACFTWCVEVLLLIIISIVDFIISGGCVAKWLTQWTSSIMAWWWSVPWTGQLLAIVLKYWFFWWSYEPIWIWFSEFDHGSGVAGLNPCSGLQPSLSVPGPGWWIQCLVLQCL